MAPLRVSKSLVKRGDKNKLFPHESILLKNVYGVI